MEESQILLSIIIPAFNAEKYVEKCISRIIPVLENDIECIIVDDGSIDNTLKLLKAFSVDIFNIKIISQDNTGVSGARNTALSNAKGIYTCCIDIDDNIDTIVFGKTIEYLRNNLFEELVIFPHYEGNKKSGFYLKRQLLPEGKSTDLSALYSATFTQKLNEPWKKIYRTDILHNNNVNFPISMYMGEDICMFVDYLQYIHSYSYVNLPYYYYNKNDNSASARVKTSFIEQEMKLYSYLNDYIYRYSLDKNLDVENKRLFLHKITRYVEILMEQKVSKQEIRMAIVQSGAENRIKQTKYINKVDLVRKWLLVNHKYFILTVILKIFKGK